MLLLNDRMEIKTYKDVFLTLKKILKPFTDNKGIFQYGKYQKFFIDWNEKDLSNFYKTTNQAVISLITGTQTLPKEGKFLIGYAIDLIGLICSDLNIKARLFSLDEKRAHTDIHKFKPTEIVGDMLRIMEIFKKEENEVVIIPADYSSTYNVSDYIIFIFLKPIKWFDLPHFYEAKNISPATEIDEKMGKRLEKQKLRTKELINTYDKKRDTLHVFTMNESYFQTKRKEIFQAAKNKKREIKIDDVFSLIVTDKKKIPHTETHWYNNIFEEFNCAGILPLIFRGIPLSFIQELLESNLYIQIKTDKRELKSFLENINSIEKIDKHPNPFQAYVHIKNVGKISIANIIHHKFTSTTLKHIFDNLDIYTQECHGYYGTDKTINHKIMPKDLQELEHAYSLIYATSFSDICDFSQASWNLTESFLQSVKSAEAKNLTHKQRVCIFFLGKGQRLLRSIFLLTINGYYAEAEILVRALFEAKLLLSYILRGKTDKRATKWLEWKSPSERWPIAELHKELDCGIKEFYAQLSTYPHSHPISLGKFVKFEEKTQEFSIERGPLWGKDNLERAGELLGYAGMENGAICEVSAPFFNLKENYERSHAKLEKNSFYKNRFEQSLQMMAKNPEIEKELEKMLGRKIGKHL